MNKKEIPAYQRAYQSWLNDPCIRPQDKEELRGLTDPAEIQDRFYRDLSFGTAGLRGITGMGKNRMNRYTVGRATQGYAHHLLAQADARTRGIAIAYDSRRDSDAFALEAALVLCANGIKAYLFDAMRAVPQLSFAIGHLGCIGGIVITASHNPKQYNGYKVYGENGAQIGPQIADAVTAAIENVSDLCQVQRMEEQDAVAAGLLQRIGEEVDDAYFAYTEGLCMDAAIWKQAADMPVVYTPLHGTGALAVPRILKDMGLQALYTVKEQMQRDPAFSTVSAPNPEAADALDMAKALAKEKQATLVLATDPDADRLGVAVRDPHGNYQSLTGNQIGALLFDYIVQQYQRQGRLPAQPIAVRSLVSAHLVDAIAQKNGIALREVLTGFRYIGEIVAETVDIGEETFIFGFEESFGYLHGTKVRDKDAICAAMLLCECALYHGQAGKTLLDALEEICNAYGYYVGEIYDYTLYGVEGLEKIKAAMKMLRQQSPSAWGGVRLTAVRDYQKQQRIDLLTAQHSPIQLPLSDIVYYELEDGSWICIRPSGTEPKLKIYVNTVGSTQAAAQERCQRMMQDVRAVLDTVL